MSLTTSHNFETFPDTSVSVCVFISIFVCFETPYVTYRIQTIRNIEQVIREQVTNWIKWLTIDIEDDFKLNDGRVFIAFGILLFLYAEDSPIFSFVRENKKNWLNRITIYQRICNNDLSSAQCCVKHKSPFCLTWTLNMKPK